jgi:hypothetical protein
MKIVRSEQIYPLKKPFVDDNLEKITTDDLNANDLISSNENLASSSSVTSISDDDTFNAEECWRGLKNIRTGPLINSKEKKIHMPSTPKKRRTKYLEPCPELDRLLMNKAHTRSTKNTLLKNGNLTTPCSLAVWTKKNL